MKILINVVGGQTDPVGFHDSFVISESEIDDEIIIANGHVTENIQNEEDEK